MTTRFRSMSLKSRTSIILFMLMLLNILLMYGAVSLFLAPRIRELEDNEVRSHINRAEKALDGKIHWLSKVTFDWSVWDATYDFIDGANASYVEDNMPPETFANLQVNSIAILDLERNCVYAGQQDLTTRTFVPMSSHFLSAIQSNPHLTGLGSGEGASGLIRQPEGLMMVSSRPVVHSDGSGPANGFFIVGRYLDEKEIADLSEQVNLKVTIEPSGAAGDMPAAGAIGLAAGASAQERTAGKDAIRVIDADTISGSTMLRDLDGQPIADLLIMAGRETYAIGRHGIMNGFLSLITVCIIYTITILILINHSVLNRLARLSKEVRSIGDHNDFSSRVNGLGPTDEIGVVTKEINQMMDHLEQSQKQLLESRDMVTQANRVLETRVRERTADLLVKNRELELEISRRRQIQEQVEHLAYHDHLTGLANRLQLNIQINHAISLANRAESNLAILFLDLDGFKMINDTMGHAIGDQLIVEVAGRLSATLRDSDTIARQGGDEFIILAENLHDSDDARLIAEKVLKCFTMPFDLGGNECFITASIGISLYPDDGGDAECLIKNADLAMYKAKAGSKNHYVFCSGEMKGSVIETMQLSNMLYRAIERNEFLLHYQPQVSIHNQSIIGFEALLRWHQPQLGMISPSRFIPIAEQTGLIIPIGEWVLRSACRQHVEWRRSGCGPLRMCVNLSIRQFQSSDILQQVRSILDETGMDPVLLELEITESIAMMENHGIIKTLHAFKEMGIHIAIDDFGTEYSSLVYLKQLPVDRIKIAMPFIKGINVNAKDEAITQLIITLARNLGMDVIAEGVETETQLDFLAKRLCNEVQGFYFYRPLPLGEAERLLFGLPENFSIC